MNLYHRLKFGDSFCVLPFIHKHIDVDGNRRVCCVSPKSITQDRILEIRQLMLDGKSIDECASCVSSESNKTTSERQSQSRVWLKNPNIQNWINECTEVSYDLRYSNLCNLRCQTCGPNASSAWAEYLQKNDVYKTWEPDSIDINPDCERIYLAGGEPFLIKSFSKALNNVTNIDCEIVVNTNATILTNHMLEALSRFKNVCFVLSIDGIGPVIEKIRIGCKWKVLQQNIATLREKLNPYFIVNTVLQLDNIDDMPNIADWIDREGINIWHVSVLSEPKQYHYSLYKGNIKWEKNFLTKKCVQTNQQAQSALRTVYKNLYI